MMDFHIGDGLLNGCLTWLGTCMIFLPRHWRSSNSFCEVLHNVHMEIITCLENVPLRKKRILHPGGGHWAIDKIG